MSGKVYFRKGGPFEKKYGVHARRSVNSSIRHHIDNSTSRKGIITNMKAASRSKDPKKQAYHKAICAGLANFRKANGLPGLRDYEKGLENHMKRKGGNTKKSGTGKKKAPKAGGGLSEAALLDKLEWLKAGRNKALSLGDHEAAENYEFDVLKLKALLKKMSVKVPEEKDVFPYPFHPHENSPSKGGKTKKSGTGNKKGNASLLDKIERLEGDEYRASYRGDYEAAKKYGSELRKLKAELIKRRAAKK